MFTQVLRNRLIIWSFSLLTTLMVLSAANMAVATNVPPPINSIPSESPNRSYIPHQLVVRMHSSNAAAELSLPASVQSVQATLSHSPTYLLTLDPAANEVELAASLSQWSSVEWAQPNYVLSSVHPIQGSYPFPDQNLVGSFQDQYASSMLNLIGAHGFSMGTGVKVGIIDAGIDFASPALNGKAVSGYDFVDNDADASDVPGGIASGHGTFVAGVIHLTAPNASLRAYRVINANGAGDGFTLARAIEMATDDGCSIINLSLALTQQHLAVSDAIDYAASHGVTVIAGAGNDGKAQVAYPAADQNAIAVAAVDSTRQATTYTNFGPRVDVCAPGDHVYSAYPNPAYAWWSGTSFSAAFTSGLAALLKQTHPGAFGIQIRDMIVWGATNIDSLNPQRSGGLGAGLINPLASLSDSAAADTILIFPSTMHFSYYQCSQNPGPLMQSCVIVPTDGPTTFALANMYDDGGGIFVSQVLPSQGNTADSIRISVQADGRGAGTYHNTIVFQVQGARSSVILPVELQVLACNDTTSGVQLTPSEEYFTAFLGQNTVYNGSSVLTSQNGTAPFHASIESTPSRFVTLLDSVGATNDSVRFTVNPAMLFSAGQYTNTIDCVVEGISAPAKLVVHLTISDSLPSGNNAWMTPAVQNYSANVNSTQSIWGSVTVGAAGGQKPFNVGVYGHRDFLTLVDSSGITNDSATFRVMVTPSLGVGMYVDTLVAYVSGAPNSPVFSVVNLRIDSIPGTGSDTALALPSSMSFSAPGGVPTQSSGAFVVYSSGSPKPFSVNYLNSPHFTSLTHASGNTNDSAKFNIVPTSTVPGTYVDSLTVTVAGVSNSPLLVVNTLVISSGSGSPTAAVSPTHIVVNAAVGGPVLTKQALVTSSNAPVWFVAYVLPTTSLFVTIPDSLGSTNDSLTFRVNTAALSPGNYSDTIRIIVYGVSAPLNLPVDLHLTSSSPANSSSDKTALWNYPNPFNPSTKIGFTLQAPAQVRLEVYNLLGQKVTTLIDRMLPAGEHSVNWDGQNSPSGIYYYRLTAGSFTQNRKMLLLK